MQYIVQFGTLVDTAAVASHIRGMLAEAGIDSEVDQDGSLIEFDKVAYDHLRTLSAAVDGRIDRDGDIWWDGEQYAVGQL